MCEAGDQSKHVLWSCKQICYRGLILRKDQRYMSSGKENSNKQKQIKRYLAIWCYSTNGNSREKKIQTTFKERSSPGQQLRPDLTVTRRAGSRTCSVISRLPTSAHSHASSHHGSQLPRWVQLLRLPGPLTSATSNFLVLLQYFLANQFSLLFRTLLLFSPLDWLCSSWNSFSTSFPY